MSNVLFYVTNEEDGMEARVYLNADGVRYNVALVDLDAEMVVGDTYRIFVDQSQAYLYAMNIVGKEGCANCN